MDSIAPVSYEEILKIAEDPELKSTYVNKELMGLMLARNKDISKAVDVDLQYDEIKEFIENIGQQILSKFSEEERKSLSWEHVGSTSIPGMPGSKHPDALLIYENYPPSKKIFDILLGRSFHFWKFADHMDDNDWWFVYFIKEEGYLHDCMMTLHVSHKNGSSSKLLLGMRDLCMEQQWAFDKYKAIKMSSVNAAKHFGDYKESKNKQISDDMLKDIWNYVNEK